MATVSLFSGGKKSSRGARKEEFCASGGGRVLWAAGEDGSPTRQVGTMSVTKKKKAILQFKNKNNNRPQKVYETRHLIQKLCFPCIPAEDNSVGPEEKCTLSRTWTKEDKEDQTERPERICL